MIYFIAGASGSGNSAIIDDLKFALPKATIHDFDDIGVPENADKNMRCLVFWTIALQDINVIF